MMQLCLFLFVIIGIPVIFVSIGMSLIRNGRHMVTTGEWDWSRYRRLDRNPVSRRIMTRMETNRRLMVLIGGYFVFCGVGFFFFSAPVVALIVQLWDFSLSQ